MSDFRRIIRDWEVQDQDLFFADIGLDPNLGVDISVLPLSSNFIDYLDLSFGPRFSVGIVSHPLESSHYGYWYNRDECIEYLGPLVRKRQKLALRR